MSTITELGLLRNVDLRTVWPNEAVDFTPWLEQHIAALGDVLDMELVIEKREAPVGDYSLDLLARDLRGNRDVVIENQLTRTDHKHLGQLLTYAAGYDASVIVWLAKDVTEGHRQALDWLNQRTDANTKFFGVVVELLSIDGSRPALNFKLVASPNEWRKTNIGSGSDGGLSERGESYRTFFQDLVDRLREQHQFTNARRGQPQSWFSFTSGFAGLGYNSSFARGRRARVELYVDSGEKESNEQLFDGLMKKRESLERELGESLEWERLDEKRACRISAVRPGSIDDDEKTLEEIRDWMIDRLLKFKEVFGPRLAELRDV